MSRNLIRVKGKKPKMAKVGWWKLPKSKREEIKAKEKKRKAKVKAADIERRNASAKYKMALMRRRELEAKSHDAVQSNH